MRKAIYTLALCGISIVISSVAFLGLNGKEVSANGAPIKIILTYQPSVSNWGPTDATGVAEVVMKEGEIDISVVGLPPLADEAYAGWIVNTHNNDSLRFGRFNTDDSKTAKVRAILPSEIPDDGWNLVLITVERKGQSASSPSDRRSIAGYFPDATEAQRAPSQLPKTGGDSGSNISNTNLPGFNPLVSSKSERSGTGDNWFNYALAITAVFGVAIFARKSLRRQ